MLESLQNHLGERLDFAFHEGRSDASSLVVIGHGVTANKDRPFVTALAEALSTAGVPTLRLSFAGNGESEGRFEDSCISKEVDELGAVLDQVEAALGDRRARTEIYFVGHSMGGAVGVLRAASDQRISRLVSLAGMVATGEFCDRKFGDLTPGQDLMWDKPECPLSQTYVDDLHGIGSTIGQAREIQIPWLLVHGDADTVVPIRDSEEAAAQGSRTQLVTLPGVDHVFSDGGTQAMVDTVVPFLTQLD
ncbi:MAG: alpha/beta fold hydrolase [Planctomycetota bacterium]